MQLKIDPKALDAHHRGKLFVELAFHDPNLGAYRNGALRTSSNSPVMYLRIAFATQCRGNGIGAPKFDTMWSTSGIAFTVE
jgi:hypothetical protein